MIAEINHTQISNDFLDKYMNLVSGNAVKLFLAIARKTIGWHKDTDRIADSQIQKITGLSVNTIKKARQELLDLEIIIFIREGLGKNTKTFYEINYNNMKTKKSNVSKFDMLNFNVSNFDTKNAFNVSKFDSTKEKNLKKYNIKKEQIDEIYNLYPTRCYVKNTSTNKNSKNKNQIKLLLKKYNKDQISKTINNYLNECKKNKIWIKNFSTFLNQFPEPEAEYDIENMSVEEVEKLMELGKI